MRKLLTIIALVLTVAMCATVAVSAAEVETTKTALGTVSKDVTVIFDATSADTDTAVYSVDVAWEDVSFSYSAGTTKWNPEKHDYTSSGDAAKWTDNEGAVKVTNHSNASVGITVAFTKASTANGTADITVTNGSFTLASAVDTPVNGAPNNTATLKASGVPTSNATIGTVKVTVAAK